MPRMLSRAVLQEIKKQALIPLEILEIATENPYSTFEMFFVNNLRPIIFADVTYAAVGFQRTPAEYDISTTIDRVSISIDNVAGFWTNYMKQRSITGMRARIRKIFLGITDDSENAIVIFDGYIGTPRLSETAISFDLRSVIAYKDTDLPKRNYGPNCNASLGDEWCMVDMTLPVNTREIVVGSGSSTSKLVDLARLGDLQANHWNPGYIRMKTGPEAGTVRPIRRSLPGKVYLEIPLLMDPTGHTAQVTRACRKTKLDCDGRFGNLDSYKGFSEQPRRPILVQ